MPRAKKAPPTPEETTVEELNQPKRVAIKVKSPIQWGNLLRERAATHYRTLRIEIQMTGKLLAGKPAKLDVAKAMIKARGLEAAIEAVDIDNPNELATAAAEAADEGLCEFHRREGHPGIWFPTNNIKAGLKENWSVMGYRKDHLGSRGALAEGVFVISEQAANADPEERDWLYIGSEPHGIHEAVSHTQGPKGPVSALKRNEYLIKPRLVFLVTIAKNVNQKLDDSDLADTLVHYGDHGLGACRSQGFGHFMVERIEEIELVVPQGLATRAA